MTECRDRSGNPRKNSSTTQWSTGRSLRCGRWRVRPWSTSCSGRGQQAEAVADTEMTAPGQADSLRPGTGRAARLIGDVRGAVYVEFLIAFLPVYVFFLCLIQLTILFSSRLVVEHAALNAARAAAVVIGDDPAEYSGEAPNWLEPDGERLQTIRKAAILTLSPLILTGLAQDVELIFPDPEIPGGPGQTDAIHYQPMGETDVGKVRVRVEVEVACRIGFANLIACDSNLFGGSPLGPRHTKLVRAEAMYPYQGASYDYP